MTQPQQAEGTGGTQAVDRAAALLRLVVEADVAITFGELCETTGLARSTTSRLLAALEHNGLIERVGSGEYVGGPLFVLYAARHDPTAELARLARPRLELLGEETRETVHLAVANGSQVAHVEQVDSTYLLGARDWTDVQVPAHCSALGKVLLAWGALSLPTGRLDVVTEHTLRTRSALDAELALVRRRGYAVTTDELEVGLAGIATPVFGPEQEIVAAVGISGPTVRLQGRDEDLARILMEQTEALSRQLRRRTQTEGVA